MGIPDQQTGGFVGTKVSVSIFVLFFFKLERFLDPSQGQDLKSYGIEVQHVTADDHGQWQMRTTNEDGDISSTGTFYVTVAKEPKDIKILCLNKVTSNMEECDDQVTHFNVHFQHFLCV